MDTYALVVALRVPTAVRARERAARSRPPEAGGSKEQLHTNLHAARGVATHIASALDRFNQIPMSLLDRYGFTLLNSCINSPAARAANIPIPYAGFGSLDPSK